MEGGQLYGYGSSQTIRKWKVANYRDNESGQLSGYGRWPTKRIWKVDGYGRWPTDNRDMEGGRKMKGVNYTDNGRWPIIL